MNWTKITEKDYHDALGAVPPAAHYHDGFLLGEPHDHRRCKVTGRFCNTYRAYAIIDGVHYKGDPATPPEFYAARAKGFSI